MLAGVMLVLTTVQGVPPTDVAPAAVQEGPVPFSLVEEQSVFAVVTDKGGIAAAKAHRHLVVASRYKVELSFDESDPLATGFSFTTRSEDLVVDDPEHKTRWAARIAELGVTDDLGDVSANDREKIRNEMLDDDQLDPENHPEIIVQVFGVRERGAEADSGGEPGATFPFLADVAVSVRGQTVQRSVPASYSVDGDTLTVEALGEFTFREFGISPYSAFLGAVKVKNEFHMYVRLVALRG